MRKAEVVGQYRYTGKEANYYIEVLQCGVVWDYAYLTPTDFYATCIGCTVSNR